MTSSVLITGAGRGLGFCLVESFLDAGWTVFAGERRTSAPMSELARLHPDRLVPIVIDVAEARSVASASERLRSLDSSLDVLINNAAILPEAGRGPIEKMNIEIGLDVYNVNALGPLRMTQSFLPLLKRSQRRLILNISSEAGSIADCWRKDEFSYCMSKAALNMQTAILQNHLRGLGFRVLAVHPGWMRTDMGGAKADLEPEQSARGILELIGSSRAPDAPIYVDHTGTPLRW